MMHERVKSVAVFLTGGAALLLGVAYYVAFRQPESVLFLDMFNIEKSPRSIGFADFFPSFIHVFSFSLMTSALVWQNASRVRWVCASWVLINVAFECAQLMPPNFIWSGTFDFRDILASLLGGIAALIVIVVFSKGRPK